MPTRCRGIARGGAVRPVVSVVVAVFAVLETIPKL